MYFFWMAGGLLTLILVFLAGLRWFDYKTDKSVWQTLVTQALASSSGTSENTYDPAMVKDLPEPARRYFDFSITAGTGLVSAVEIEMGGDLGLGSIDKPNYTQMSASQILAPPHGYVWRVNVGALSGSDGATEQTSWSRFWLFGLIPVVRAGGNPDHHRSAFGRLASEAVFWTPASLLPSKQVCWQSVDANTARAIISLGEYTQAVDLTVAANGQPQRVIIQRWSNENQAKEFIEQPFGGYLDEFRDFGGYLLPTSVEGGNLIGTDQYFPFYKARVSTIRLLSATK